MQEILLELKPKKNMATGVRLVIGYLGFITMIVGAIILMPLVMLIAFPKDLDHSVGFFVSGGAALVLGGVMSFAIFKKTKGRLAPHQDAVIVVFTWLIAVFFGALPFVIDRDLSFTGAVFESTSMWTTAGMSASIPEHLPKIYLFYRGVMMFFGGVGLILVVLFLLADTRLSKIFNAEGHGDKLLPNLKKTIKAIFLIYFGYAVLGTIAYIICGMGWFDAINYSLSAISTGGGSTSAAGIAAFDSRPIEVVTIVLMLLGGTSFLIHLLMLRRKFGSVAKSTEVRFFAGYLTLMILLCFFVTGDFRLSAFHAVSAVTTTGFQAVNGFSGALPAFSLLLMLMMLVGGQNGSTSGGLKTHRLYVILSDIGWSVRARLGSPRVVRVNKWNKAGQSTVIDRQEKSEMYHFLVLFLVVFLAGAFVVTLAGYSTNDAMFYIASCIGNAGLTAGVNPATAPDGVLWTGTIVMVLGRLEIYIFLFAFFRIGKDIAGGIERLKKIK